MTVTDLSPRQRVVMQYLVDGVSFKDIADKLGIRHVTVKKHAIRAREKTGATSLYQCIALLVAHGVIVPAEINDVNNKEIGDPV
jgi:DNA-binding NarL/FixJ family response regulator